MRSGPFPVAASLAGRGRSSLGDRPHLLDHPERGVLVNLGAASARSHYRASIVADDASAPSTVISVALVPNPKSLARVSDA